MCVASNLHILGSTTCTHVNKFSWKQHNCGKPNLYYRQKRKNTEGPREGQKEIIKCLLVTIISMAYMNWL